MTSSFNEPGEDSDNLQEKPSLGSFGAPKRSKKQSNLRQPASPTPAKVAIIKPVRIEFGKRLVALIIDMLVGYLLGIVVAMIPFINGFLSVSTVIIVYFLTRDFFFEGRGIGKNFMGLRVVDVVTGQGASLLQSVERNIILVAPCVVTQIMDYIFRFIPVPWLGQTIINLINSVGMVYCLIVIPLEIYRAYNRSDGLRIGDEIAGTGEIEASMDFSNVFPRS